MWKNRQKFQRLEGSVKKVATSHRWDSDATIGIGFAALFFVMDVALAPRFWDTFSQTFTVLRGPLGVTKMEWTAPAFEEVCLNCEINSYASAKL